MGNIATIITRRHVKSYDWPSMLEEINQRRFGGVLTIEHALPDQQQAIWFDVSLDGVYLWDFGEQSTRKFGGKHPHGSGSTWRGYIWTVFYNEIGALTNGRQADEGVEGTWDSDPNKYPTLRHWYEMWAVEFTPELRNTLWKLAISGLPDKLRPYILPED